MKTGAELWAEAKGLLLPYDGMASQLYVLDLPLKVLGAALDKLSDGVSHPQVVTLDSVSTDPIPLTSEVRQRLLSSSEKATFHVLRGDWAPGQELSLWLWVDAAHATFDAEFVFWADLLFPNPENEAACIEAFSECVTLAEAFRDMKPGSECALSASESGDPRAERDRPWTLFW